MGDRDASSELFRRHLELEALHGDGNNGDFLSGWQCENPWREEIEERIGKARSEIDASRYQQLDRDRMVTERLSEFHRVADGKYPQAIFCGQGATAIIFAFCTWLKYMDVKEIFYAPPLYFSFLNMLQLFGIQTRPVTQRHAFEEDFSMNLPSSTSAFMFSDPVWYAGIHMGGATVRRIIDWQRETRSMVFVDGSFQYTRWDRQLSEATSELDRELTLRVISPTKALAFHGYRFAYATMPSQIYDEFAHVYANLYGSTSVDNLAFAKAAAEILHERAIIESITALAAARHAVLRAKGRIAADWEPTSGYFAFERIIGPLPSGVLMDGPYFEQQHYPDHRRINLLSPSIGVLG